MERKKTQIFLQLIRRTPGNTTATSCCLALLTLPKVIRQDMQQVSVCRSPAMVMRLLRPARQPDRIASIPPTGSGSQIHHSPGSRLHGGQRRDPSAWQNALHLVPHNPGPEWETRRVSFDEILPEPEKAKMIRIGLNPLVNQQTFWIRNLRVIYHP